MDTLICPLFVKPRPHQAAELHARDIESHLDGALAKTKTPHATYLASSPLERRLLNQTFFKRILVGEEGTIEDVELTPVYAALAAWEPDLGHQSPVPPRRPSVPPNGPVGGPLAQTPTPFFGVRVYTRHLWWS